MPPAEASIRPIRVPPTPSLRKWADEHGFSPELVARWGAFYPDLGKLLAAMARPSRMFIRLNRLRGDPRETLARLREEGFVLEPTPLPGAYEVGTQPFSIGATHEYLMGRYYVQDLSSLLAPLALEPRRGERIADLCAAPGGKAAMIADAVDNEASLICFDDDPERVRALTSNLNRCGVQCAAIFARPGQEAARLPLKFDRVLVDAPCTGEGVISRDSSRRKGHLGEFAACAAVQGQLLDAAAQALRPGGILVYSTCTLAPEENEFQVQRALESGRFEIESLPASLRELQLDGRALLPGLGKVGGDSLDARLAQTAHALPHLHGTLGFYVARLRRTDT